jgi:Type I phosphodiesterase / nucleotide pyrophosphatase
VTPGRRLASLLLVLALVAAPAVALRAACAGRSCSEPGGSGPSAPFCGLPAGVRDLLVRGFRDGRSPDVLGASRDGTTVATSVPGGSVAWPSAGAPLDPGVPVVFAGTGIRAGSLPDGFRLDRVAPTLERVVGLHRPHPEVRTGTAAPGIADGADPRLIVLIAWKGVGSAELAAAPDAWSGLRDLMAGGAGTTNGTVGSLPLDPAAALTTIGTGALPSHHGITGTWIRDDRGRVVSAWSDGAPPSIVSTFAEDLDERSHQRASVALVAPRGIDLGLIGGRWYLDADRDELRIGGHDPIEAVSSLLRRGYGTGPTIDLIGVVLEGPVRRMDRTTAALVDGLRNRGVPATVVIAGTGGQGPAATISSATVAARVDAALQASVSDRTVGGGLFLDRAAMVADDVTTTEVSDAMRGLRTAGRPLFADAFAAFAVSFARYC